MADELDYIEQDNAPQRPKYLKVLCILSFISTGAGLVSSFFSLLGGPASEDEMLEEKVEITKSINELSSMGMDGMSDLLVKIQAMTEQINDNFYFASIVALITVGIGFFGVLKMWKGFKVGFHLYIVYCLLSIGGLYLYVSPSNIPSVIVIFNLLFSGLFVLMYSKNLHWMTK